MKYVPAVVVATILLSFGGASRVQAQPAATYKTGAEFYLAYRVAFDKATSIDEIIPWMAKARRDEIAKAPASEKKEVFEMIKMFDDHIGVKVVKETASRGGAELQVEATSASEKTKATAVVKLLKEGAAWRISEESWKVGSGQ